LQVSFASATDSYGVLNNSSLIIDTDKLRENVRTILRSLPAGTKLIPVVKDDAYGMGMVGVARTERRIVRTFSRSLSVSMIRLELLSTP